MDQLQELEDTFIEEYEAACLLFELEKKKSAIILFAKAMFAILDYLIYKSYKKLPKNHEERFRILEIKKQEIYLIVDKIWKKYTDTYSKPGVKEAGEQFKKTIQEIIQQENENISQRIKNSTQKK